MRDNAVVEWGGLTFSSWLLDAVTAVSPSDGCDRDGSSCGGFGRTCGLGINHVPKSPALIVLDTSKFVIDGVVENTVTIFYGPSFHIHLEIIFGGRLFLMENFSMPIDNYTVIIITV